MVSAKEEIRKGPWMEQEDLQLVCFVSLFGERRWDFIAKVSGLSGGGGYCLSYLGSTIFQNKWFGLFDAGLNRTGKSCRLRWVNYLHPGLKHGPMTPKEERLILELHSEWGNRWSRIARRLPGRTDNEVKNYWRTHMRKAAQERKRNSSPSDSSSSSCLSALEKCEDGSPLATGKVLGENEDGVKVYPMEQIWNDIAPSLESGSDLSFEQRKDECLEMSCATPPVATAAQDYFAEFLWTMDDYEFNMIPFTNDYHFLTA